jgi:hypothetical protein
MLIFLILILVLVAMLFLLGQSWKKKFDRRIALGLTILVLLSIGFGVIIFVLHYEFVYEWIPWSVVILNCAGLIAAGFYLAFSKTNGVMTRVFGGLAGLLLLAGSIFTIVLVEEGDFGSENFFHENITGDYYLSVDMNEHYPVPIPTITCEKFGLIISRRNLSYCGYDDEDGNCQPDSVRFVSLKNDLLVFDLFENSAKFTVKADLRFESVSQLREGVRVVWLDHRMGAVDESGRIVIPIGYEGLSDCYNGLILAHKNGKTGYINSKNETVIPFKFDGGGNFLTDSATVMLGFKYYYIDRTGKITSEQK